MNNYKDNLKIGKILGFKFHKDGTITYPENWESEITGTPIMKVPNFIEMLEQNRKIAETFRYGIPKNYNI